ncbi:MAG: hypothetical protein ABRQ39_04795 [Candidatus Eremiobacterota bacterium]
MRIKISKNMKKQYFLLDKLTKKQVRKSIIKLRKGELILEKLSTGKNIYKIRTGDYRILIIKIEDVYVIASIEHRKEVYLKLFLFLLI